MTKKNTNTNNKIFKNDTFVAIPTSLSKASHMQYVRKDGEQITVPVSSDFKILYGFLFDQCRSFENQEGFDGEVQELYQDWDLIFRIIGRKYTGDKNSLKLVKLLEDCGLLVQTKRPNSTSTNKTVFDVTSIKSIVFSNPERDKWEQEQHQRRADRAASYAEAKAEKLAAIASAKQQHNQTVKPAKPDQPKFENPPEPKAEPKQQTIVVEPAKQEQTESDNYYYQLLKNGVVSKNKDWQSASNIQQQLIMSAVIQSHSLYAAEMAFNQKVAEYVEFNRRVAQQQEQPKAPEKKASNYPWMANLVPSAVTIKPQVTELENFDEQDDYPF